MKLPVFPLNGAILFPDTNLPLNIFEERYIEMVDYSLSNKRVIGMIQKKEDGNFFNIGCFGKITNFTETEDGRYQINLRGISRFFFKKIIKNDNKFITIEADLVKFYEKKNANNNKMELLSSFSKFLKTKNINFDISEIESLETLSLLKIICAISPLDHLIKQMLLEFNNDEDLYKNLLSVLEIEMQNIEKGVKIN